MVARRVRLCPTCGARAWADATGCPFCKTDFRALPPPCEAAGSTGGRCGLPAGHAGDHVAPPVIPKSWSRPAWAWYVLIAGLLVAGLALFLDASFVIRQHSPDASRYDSFALLPNMVLVPASAAILFVGALAVIRPYLERHRWPAVAVLAAVLLWWVAACLGPGILSPNGVQPAI